MKWLLTEAQRRHEFDDEMNWLPTRKYPDGAFPGFQIREFEYWSATFYMLQINTLTWNWEARDGDNMNGAYTPGWQLVTYFVVEDDLIKRISKTDAYQMMKEAEKKEFEHDQVD